MARIRFSPPFPLAVEEGHYRGELLACMYPITQMSKIPEEGVSRRQVASIHSPSEKGCSRKLKEHAFSQTSLCGTPVPYSPGCLKDLLSNSSGRGDVTPVLLPVLHLQNRCRSVVSFCSGRWKLQKIRSTQDGFKAFRRSRVLRSVQ
jgi:hypothetical protein